MEGHEENGPVHANIHELLNQDLEYAVLNLDLPLGGVYNHRSWILFRGWLDAGLLLQTNVGVTDMIVHMKRRAITDEERLELLIESSDVKMEYVTRNIDVFRKNLVGRFRSMACLAMTCQELRVKGPELLENIRDAIVLENDLSII